MSLSKAHIISQLQKELLALQGFKAPTNVGKTEMGLGPIRHAFPNKEFPLGAIHEFCCGDAEAAAASTGFIAALLSTLMQSGGVTIWISSTRLLFPPALQLFNIKPQRIIFIDLHKEAELLWTMEEALKCGGLASVVGEINDLSFTASRRLQLAVESSGVTGFLLRHNPRNLTTASVTRWKVTPLCTASDRLPGLSYPRWNVDLLKVRNGSPGSWQIEWVAGQLRPLYKPASLIPGQLQKKTG